jgi:hypothetical protein
MNLRALLCLAALAAPAVVAACGGGQSESAAPATPSASASASAAPSAEPTASAAPSAEPTPSATASAAPAAPSGPPGAGDWDKWSHDWKLAYMKSDVMPKMGALFHEFDAKRYDEPKCVLCHGAGAKDGSFTMPNPELPKLDLTPAGFKKLQAKKPKVMEFMLKKVEPQMASLLGEPAFDPKTKTGFGCTGCHTTVDKAAPEKAGADKAGAAPAKPAPKP